MTQPRLPDGFAVQVDRRVRVLGSGAALLGGSPTRLVRLAPAARTLLDDGRLEVRDAVSAKLARTLLDATVAHPRPCGGPSHRDVTVVIPVRDNVFGLRRLLAEVRGVRAVVVDDGSTVPLRQTDIDGLPCEVSLIRHDSARGAAAARNTGLGACQTDFVAFLDSDVVPRRGWLEALLGHFTDPSVALVAPRIVGLTHSDTAVARYEAVRSSLDLGQREAPVLPYGPVPYVPSAAIICRRSTLRTVGGFDEALQSGEDVDLCWRLVESGARLRYEPIALVAHDHRVEVREWLARKAFYGRSAAPLSTRHPDKTASMVVSQWSLVLAILMIVRSAIGCLASLLIAARTAGRIANKLEGAESRPVDVAFVAARGMASAVRQMASAICRHYWPIALVAALLFRRFRHIVVLAAVVDGVCDWLNRHDNTDDQTRPLGLVPYLVLKRLDDLAYGAGMWSGMIEERHFGPLKPQMKS